MTTKIIGIQTSEIGEAAEVDSVNIGGNVMTIVSCSTISRVTKTNWNIGACANIPGIFVYAVDGEIHTTQIDKG